MPARKSLPPNSNSHSDTETDSDRLRLCRILPTLAQFGRLSGERQESGEVRHALRDGSAPRARSVRSDRDAESADFILSFSLIFFSFFILFSFSFLSSSFSHFSFSFSFPFLSSFHFLRPRARRGTDCATALLTPSREAKTRRLQRASLSACERRKPASQSLLARSYVCVFGLQICYTLGHASDASNTLCMHNRTTGISKTHFLVTHAHTTQMKILQIAFRVSNSITQVVAQGDLHAPFVCGSGHEAPAFRQVRLPELQEEQLLVGLR